MFTSIFIFTNAARAEGLAMYNKRRRHLQHSVQETKTLISSDPFERFVIERITTYYYRDEDTNPVRASGAVRGSYYYNGELHYRNTWPDHWDSWMSCYNDIQDMILDSIGTWQLIGD